MQVPSSILPGCVRYTLSPQGAKSGPRERPGVHLLQDGYRGGSLLLSQTHKWLSYAGSPRQSSTWLTQAREQLARLA